MDLTRSCHSVSGTRVLVSSAWSKSPSVAARSVAASWLPRLWASTARDRALVGRFRQGEPPRLLALQFPCGVAAGVDVHAARGGVVRRELELELRLARRDGPTAQGAARADTHSSPHGAGGVVGNPPGLDRAASILTQRGLIGPIARRLDSVCSCPLACSGHARGTTSERAWIARTEKLCWLHPGSGSGRPGCLAEGGARDRDEARVRARPGARRCGRPGARGLGHSRQHAARGRSSDPPSVFARQNAGGQPCAGCPR